jgi:hypothetical protein
MKCRRLVRRSDRYWNIKGRHHYVAFFRLNLLIALGLSAASGQANCGAAMAPRSKGDIL